MDERDESLIVEVDGGSLGGKEEWAELKINPNSATAPLVFS